MRLVDSLHVITVLNLCFCFFVFSFFLVFDSPQLLFIAKSLFPPTSPLETWPQPKPLPNPSPFPKHPPHFLKKKWPLWALRQESESCRIWSICKKNLSHWQQQRHALTTLAFGMGSLAPRWKWPTSASLLCRCISSLNFPVTIQRVLPGLAFPLSLNTEGVLNTFSKKEDWRERKWFAWMC